MGTLLDSLKSLKLWQIGLLAAVLVGAAGATYGAYALLSGQDEQGLGQNQQLIPVQYGDLVNQVSISGSLIFPNRVTLTFGIPGTVGEVLVATGEQVEEGQPLASLNKPTADEMTKAQSQVDLAKISLVDAELSLKLAKKDWDSKLQTAQDALETAREGYRGIFQRWLGIELAQGEEELIPDTLLASWGIDLASLFDPSLRFQDILREGLNSQPPVDDPATKWNEFIVYAWLNFFPGRTVATCENKTVPWQGACVKKEMDDAWASYQKALDNRELAEIQAAKGIASAESAIVRAKDSLATAEKALADLGATLRASVAGIVSAVNVEVGRNINANTPIVEVVDPSVVEVDGIVDEIDVLFVRLGAQANVTMDALPGQVLQGTVSEIASTARSQQGVVSYPLRVLVQIPSGVQLREGLSATASIVIREERNVLLVPIQALYGTFEQPVVKVKADGRMEERPVVLGSSDDYWVAVRQGLAEGEQVVMEAQAATTGQLGILGGGMRQFQGQFPGALPGGGGLGGGFRQGEGGTRQVQPTPRPRG